MVNSLQVLNTANIRQPLLQGCDKATTHITSKPQITANKAQVQNLDSPQNVTKHCRSSLHLCEQMGTNLVLCFLCYVFDHLNQSQLTCVHFGLERISYR